MLRSSFIQVPGVGTKSEELIWGKGIHSWDQFDIQETSLKLPPRKVAKIRECLATCSEHLKKKDAAFFVNLLPKSELWRLYPEFKDSVAFVDIETTGLSPYYNQITLVGLYDGREYKAYIAGHNLDDFPKDLAKYQLIITFNGSLFDLPFLRKRFPQIEWPAHIDLRFFLRRLGFGGGLKAVERELGIRRPEEMAGLDGFDATVFWNRYVHGNIEGLRLLVDYNREDVRNLETLMGIGYDLMRKRVFPVTDRAPTPIKAVDQSSGSRPTGVRPVGDTQVELRTGKRTYLMVIPRKKRRTIAPLLRKLGGPQKAPPVVGIDLTGSEKRATGWAVLKGSRAEAKLIKTDEELIEETVKAAPRIVSIDSPLSIPGGKEAGPEREAKAIAKLGIMRGCERTLRRRGIHVYPCLLPSMKGLTRRGIQLAQRFKELGFEVIESYPGAAQDIIGIIRKKVNLQELKQGLLDFGIDGDFNSGKINHDELDAVTSALVAYFYLAGSYEGLGNDQEGYLIIPQAYR